MYIIKVCLMDYNPHCFSSLSFLKKRSWQPARSTSLRMLFQLLTAYFSLKMTTQLILAQRWLTVDPNEADRQPGFSTTLTKRPQTGQLPLPGLSAGASKECFLTSPSRLHLTTKREVSLYTPSWNVKKDSCGEGINCLERIIPPSTLKKGVDWWLYRRQTPSHSRGHEEKWVNS